jgi:hypothetical protein
MEAGSFIIHGWETVSACIHSIDDEHAPRLNWQRLRLVPQY